MPLDIFLGDSTPLHATLYARLPQGDEFAAGTLTGVVTGPRCATSRMLPADYAFSDLGAGPTRLARVRIPDPCYWSSELPALYDVRLEWRVDGEVRGRWERAVGLRRLGARGRNLMYEGRRWVLRAVRSESTDDRRFVRWNAEAAACWTSDLSDEVAAETAREGVPTVVRVSERGAAIVERLRLLTRAPSVVGVSLAPAALWEANEAGGNDQVPAAVARCRHVAPGLLLLAEAAADGSFPEWADAWVVPAERLMSSDGTLRQAVKPIIAYRPATVVADLAVARARCDELQRDLAPFGDFAGYVV